QKIWHWWSIYEDTPPEKHLVAIRAATGDVLWKKDDADTVELMPTTLAAAGPRVYFQSHKELLAMDASTGKVLWRADRAVNRQRPAWSAPTLVVYGDVVLSGDRNVDGAAPGLEPPERPGRWIVNSLGGVAPVGQIVAFKADSGERLWEADCRECYNAPVDVLVAGGLVWSGNLVSAREPGITRGLDVNTGEVVRTRPADNEFFRLIMGHHRCHRNKATEKYLVLGRDGIEMIDVATGEGFGNAWVRGTCQYGVMPCNGLIYAPPHSCACHVESLLNSFNCLAPKSETPEPEPTPQLQPGPAYKQIPNPKSQIPNPSSWPTYRHDGGRSGRSSCSVPVELKPAWEAELPGGRLSSPVVAGGKVFVARIDAHTVSALDAETGRLLWEFTAGGRVDSPPTIHAGTAIFGSADGSVYCLRADDGAMAWQFRVAPHDRRIVSYGQIESAWPVHGSVLVEQGVVYAAAGRSTHLDGGMTLCRLDAATGKKLSETPITGGTKPDVLSSDAGSIFMRHRRFDRQGVEQKTAVPHLYSPAGFLESSWWHRTYWIFGAGMRSNWGGWPVVGNQVPAGRLMVLDESNVYGFGRFNQYHRDGSHVGLGHTRYLLYGCPRPGAAKGSTGQPRRPGAKPTTKVAPLWQRPLPILARGMVLADETLFVAGPPDTFVDTPEDISDRYHVASVEATSRQQAALAGKMGGSLLAVSTVDGKQLAQYKLPAPPEWDALIAAAGRLYLVTVDGKVRCFSSR
ncbi:MAG: PQQ-binding-like beta-propeller repeat protein, partial [Candidatus Nealsonbacteria bacterium]|nr:PQQ-binding-like beta-propeller repeat protein [Candidatus Nealsonbacteria bacterium]